MGARRSPDLFDAAGEDARARRAPLAERLRPGALSDVVGQEHLLGPRAPFRRLLEAGKVSSAILFGPPGTGKTTVARLIARHSGAAFVELSATSAGVREVREVLEGARRELGTSGRSTVLFLDEIHRFSRAQQDSLLHGVEDGTVTLVGATTENPFFSIVAPLLSRSSLLRFEPLGADALARLARRALEAEGAEIDAAGLGAAVELADGDGRRLLGGLEAAISLARVSDGAHPVVRRAEVEAARASPALRHGRDEHYDVLSALIKALRGSDPDAGLYWLARLLRAGEDPRVAARRLLVLASEDIGMADPTALVVTEAAVAALDRVGLPEAGLNLAQAVVHLATAPKSNRVALAWWAAEHDVEHGPGAPVPERLRDAHYRGAASLGHGVGYDYPHDHPDGFVEVSYLPDPLVGRRYYEPSGRGHEAAVGAHLAALHARAAERSAPAGGAGENGGGTAGDMTEATGGRTAGDRDDREGRGRK